MSLIVIKRRRLIWGVLCALSFCSIAITIRNASADSLPNVPDEVLKAGYMKEAFFDDFTDLAKSLDGNGPGIWFNGLWFEKPSAHSNFVFDEGGLTLRSPQGVGVTTTISTMPHNGGAARSFLHGYFEARLRWNVDPGNWAAFWLFSEAHARGVDAGQWCEIDVFEAFENHGHGIFAGTIHGWINGKDSQNANHFQRMSRRTDFGEWHDYGLLWLPDRVTWYLDQREVMSAAVPAQCEKQQLFVNLTAQRHGGDKDETLSVKWIRVWQ
jgi:hypothetical protein